MQQQACVCKQMENGSLKKVLEVMCGIFRRPIWIMWQDVKQCSEDFLGEMGLSRLPLGVKNPEKVDLLALVTIWHAVAWRSWFNHAKVRWGTYCWQAWRSVLELVFEGCSTQHWKFPSGKGEQGTGMEERLSVCKGCRRGLYLPAKFTKPRNSVKPSHLEASLPARSHCTMPVKGT